MCTSTQRSHTAKELCCAPAHADPMRTIRAQRGKNVKRKRIGRLPLKIQFYAKL